MDQCGRPVVEQRTLVYSIRSGSLDSRYATQWSIESISREQTTGASVVRANVTGQGTRLDGRGHFGASAR